MSGVQQGMAFGEDPVSLVTPNLQVTVTNTLVSSIGDSSITTPLTSTQSASGIFQPKITFGPNGLSGCVSASASAYTHLALVQWGKNPYAGSKTVKSSPLRFSAVSSEAKTLSLAGTGNVTNKGNSNGNGRATLPTYGVPAYTISLQFTSAQNFNFTASMIYGDRSKNTPNFTLPACTLYDGTQYVPCKGCNISSYTNYNVTYGCYDITQLCPAQSSKRHLREASDNDDYDDDADDEDEADERWLYDSSSNSDTDNYDKQLEGPDSSSSGDRDVSRYTRSLQAAGDDDGGSSGKASSSATFGVILQSVGQQMNNVLSNNPFKADILQSTIVLTFVGCMTGFVFIMLMFLRRLDYKERVQKVYVKRARDKAARKLLEKDIKNGGKGNNLEVMYQGHMNDFHHQKYVSGTIMNNIRRLQPFKKRSNSDCKSTGSVTDNKNRIMCTNDMGDHSDITLDFESIGFDSDESHDQGRNHAMTAVVTEFLYKLFPGRSIFKKNRNALNIVYVNHVYTRMFAGSSLKTSRSIRFLQLVSLVLVCLFVDTIFFGVFYPTNDPCVQYDTKVSDVMHYIILLHWLLFALIFILYCCITLFSLLLWHFSMMAVNYFYFLPFYSILFYSILYCAIQL